MLFVIALMMPPEVSLYLGELRVTPYRVVLILSIGYCLFLLLSGRAGRIRLCDSLIILHGGYVFTALTFHHGLIQGLESGGIYFIEAIGAYLFARRFIRNAVDFRGFVAMLSFMVIAMALFTVVESLTGKHLIRETAREFLGGPALPHIADRFGLARAFGSFEHPILYGVFCASAFALSVYVLGNGTNERGRPVARSSVIMVATVVSLSAGAFVALFIQFGLLVWERLTRIIAGRWLLLCILLGVLWVMVDLLSNRTPIHVALTYLTFNPTTAYNRMLIWEFGTDEVVRNPIFGIGFNEWIRPEWMHSGSMDNFWLVGAVRYGLPSFILLAAAILLIWKRVATLKGIDSLRARYRTGWIICMVGLAVAGCTVHFWNALFVLFMFIVGSGVWMLETPDRSPLVETE